MKKSALTNEQAIKKVLALLENHLKNDNEALDDLYIELGNGWCISCNKALKRYTIEEW